MSTPNPYASSDYSPGTEKLLSVAIHLLAIPFEFFAPVIGYFVFKDKGPFISHHVKESINFSITMLLVLVVLAVSIIGWAFLWAPPIYWAIMRIIAAVKAAQGEFYKYPFTLRLINS
jgi:uncharacterized protein